MQENRDSLFNTENIINKAYEEIKEQNFDHKKYEKIVFNIIEDLDQGKIKVATKTANGWETHPWVKKAILLYFKLKQSQLINETESLKWFDKIDQKFNNFTKEDFNNHLIRAVPGSFTRKGSYIGRNVVLMPSFINIGAYIGDNTMIDAWSTIGSCAQVGKNCHISGGVGLGGVLEPLQANPVIIEDNCFIGARSEIAEGVIVEEGSVISMGVFIGASTKIYNRETREITYGKVPAYSVIVPGSLPSKNNCALYAAIIVKQVDAKTRAKTSINEILREL